MVFIKQIEERTSTNTGKKFWSAETDQGKMSIFDSEIIEEMGKKGVPNEFNVQIQEKGNFTNIVGITPHKEKKVLSESFKTDKPVEETTTKSSDYWKAKERRQFSGMAIAYIKDLIVAGKIEYSKLRKETMGLMSLYNDLN